MKNACMNILLLFFMLVSCSEITNDKKADSLTGPHSEITIQYNSQEIQPYQTEGNVILNENLIHILQTDSIIRKAVIATRLKISETEIAKIKDQLSFESIEKTNVITIHFYDSNESFANSFLKNLVEVLSVNLLDEAYIKANQQIRKIETELDSAKVALIKIEERMEYDPTLVEEQKRQEKIYLYLVEQRTTLTIQKAGIVNHIKILDGPIYKLK